MSFRRIIAFPLPPYGCQKASVSTSGLILTLQYVFEMERALAVGQAKFLNFVAFRFSDEGHSGVYVPESSEGIAESDDSDWLRELKARVPDGNRWPFARKHFATFLQNVGYYEIIAESVSEEKPVVGET